MIQGDDNSSFGDSINDHDASSTRIIFPRTNNGQSIDTNAHFLREIIINNKFNKTKSSFLLKQTPWKNKRVHDTFRKTIAQYWKDVAVTTSETNLSSDSIYKPDETTISVDNKIRL